MDRIARIGHEHDVARRGDRLRHVGEAFLRAERGDHLAVRIELHAEAAGVIGGLGAAEARRCRARRNSGWCAACATVSTSLSRMCGGVGRSGLPMPRSMMSAPPARARRLQPVHLLEDIGRQAPDLVKLVHGRRSARESRSPSSAAPSRVNAKPLLPASALAAACAASRRSSSARASSAAISARIARRRPPLGDQRQLRLDRLHVRHRARLVARREPRGLRRPGTRPGYGMLLAGLGLRRASRRPPRRARATGAA